MVELQEQFQHLADAVWGESGVPGLALYVSHNGQHAFATSGVARINSDEVIDPDARFDLSCLMKFFLSVTALKLAARQKLDLQTDISVLLPELGPPRGIHMAHLMSHTSGYHGLDVTDMAVRWNSRWDGFAAGFCDRRQFFPPGAVFNYEHSEHVVLGEALRRLFAKSPSELVDTNLLAPLGVKPQLSPANDNGISPHAFSARKGTYVPTRLPPFGPFWEASLPAATITLSEVAAAAGAAFADRNIAVGLCTPVADLPELARSEPRAEQPPRHFSAASGIYEGGLFGHNGSITGQTMGFRIDPQTGAIAAAAVNAYSPHARDSLLHRSLDLVAGRENKPPLRQNGESAVHSPEFLFDGFSPPALAGRYTGSYLGEIWVDATGDALDVTVGPSGSRQSNFRIAATKMGFAIQSQVPIAIGFRKGKDGTPILYLGVHAYKPA